jgi:RNA polymerase sigma-70 factor (ECF subfamily)
MDQGDPVHPQSTRLPVRRERQLSVVTLPVAANDDAALIEGLIARRPAAAAKLFDRFEPTVRGLLVRMLGGSRDLDDLVQDTFLVVIRQCARLRDASALRSFVVSIAIRTAKAELRKRRLWKWVGLGDELEPPVTPAHDAVAAEGIRRIYQLLDQFDTTSRLAFLLRRVEGRELTETAEACGCSLATLKRKLARIEKRFDALAKVDPVLSAFLRQEQQP